MYFDNPQDDDLDNDSEYTEIDQKMIDLLEKELNFERKFYSYVGGTDNFEVLLIPDEKGYVPTKEEIDYIEEDARIHKIKVLYRVSHGKFATVFNPETGKVGVMPENNTKGFAC
jgi:hypothetical protein